MDKTNDVDGTEEEEEEEADELRTVFELLDQGLRRDQVEPEILICYISFA